MKAKEVIRQHNLDGAAFEQWLPRSGYTFKQGFTGIDIEDGQNIDELVAKFKADYAERQAAAKEAREKEQAAAQEARAKEQAAAQEKQRAKASMLITSGFSFDGYTITKYSGYISGDDAVQVARGQQGFWGGGATDVGAALMASLVTLRRNALDELREAAWALGCNAVIGVDFDYLTLEPETVNNQGGTLYMPYVFGVTANGNAVVIEKNDRVAG